MLFKFIGEYTNGHDTIDACGVLFHGREPSDVTSEDGIRRLSGHVEFAKVTAKEVETEAGEGEKDDLAEARKDYADVFGKKPFNGWNADTLRAKIAERGE